MNTEYIELLREEYKQKHIKPQERDELIEEIHIAKSDIKGYHGREIFEMLQNADDAYQKSIINGSISLSPLEVNINFKNNILAISNTGTFFDKEGIKAIIQGNNSPKSGKYIGHKGTGFRSLLNWAHTIRIFSGEFAVEFSETIAEEFFDEIKNEKQIQKQIEICRKRNETLFIPMLAVPKNISHTRNKDLTTIEIELNSAKNTDDHSVINQLEEIDLHILLFLPNLSSINITTEEDNIIYKREITNESLRGGTSQSRVLLKKICDIEETEEYDLFRKTIPSDVEKDKEIQLAIAIPISGDTKSKHLYSYFPLLATESPFNCIMHATYDLGTNRNTMNLNAANKDVMHKQLEFIIEIAQYYYGKKDLDKVYRLLLPSNYKSFENSPSKWTFTSAFSGFKLEEYYVDRLLKEKIFINVNHKSISLLEKPWKIWIEFPSQFKGQKFSKLLQNTKNEEENKLIKFITEYKAIKINPSPEDLCLAINNISQNLTLKNRIEVFVWWNKNMLNCQLLPNILKNSEGKWLKYNDPCYMLEGNLQNIKLPKWVIVTSLEEKAQKLLEKEAEKNYNIHRSKETGSVIRQICQNKIFSQLDFTYRDVNSIIPAVSSSVKANRKKAVEFVKWLWKNYKNSNNKNTPKDNERGLKFPIKDHGVGMSNILFFSDSYGNSLSKKLFTDDYSEFPDYKEFGIAKSEFQDFINFIGHFGVKNYPQIIFHKFENSESDYSLMLKRVIFESGVFNGTASSKVSRVVYSVETILDIENIITRLSTKEILLWIISDHTLRVNLSNPICNAEVSYIGDSQFNWRTYKGEIPNYILFKFNHLPWIEIDGMRYSPYRVLNGFSNEGNRYFDTHIPVLTKNKIKEIAKEAYVNIETALEIFSKFDFPRQVTDLCSEDFYGLILKASEQESSENFALFKAIYRIVEQGSFKKIFDYSPSKDKFFKEGRLLVEYKGKYKFHTAKESFLPSVKIILKKEYPIIAKGQRTNNENFIRIFGCREYNFETKVISGSEIISKSNERFQKYFSEFLRYAVAYKERNENINKILSNENFSIDLIESVKINEEENERLADEKYSLIRISDVKWFIIIGKNDYNTMVLSECIENIFSNIANSPGFDAGKLGELFRAKNEDIRKFLIQKEFGSSDMINYNGAIEFEIIRERRKLIKSLIIKEKNNYKNYLYQKAVSNVYLQNNFIKNIEEFESFGNNVTITASGNFLPEKILIEEFGEWKKDGVIDISADEIYKNNYNKLNPDGLFIDEIQNDTEVQKMIWFGLEKDFLSWIRNHST